MPACLHAPCHEVHEHSETVNKTLVKRFLLKVDLVMASPHNRTVTKTASKIASTLNSLDSEVQYKTEKIVTTKKALH